MFIQENVIMLKIRVLTWKIHFVVVLWRERCVQGENVVRLNMDASDEPIVGSEIGKPGLSGIPDLET